MKCPKCGYIRQPSDNRFAPATECPACGVVYSKTGTDGTSQPLAAAAINKPSPVNEDTLKRARERVDMKLKKQMESSHDDERRKQTLQRAKILATDAVRQRQEEWKRRQLAKQGEPDDLTISEAAIRVKDPTADLDAFKGGALTMFGVIRPKTDAKEAGNGNGNAARSDQKPASSVSLSDSLANRPPGEDLSYDTHPTNPALAGGISIRMTTDNADAVKAVPASIGSSAPEKSEVEVQNRRDEQEMAALSKVKGQPPTADSAAVAADDLREAAHENVIDSAVPEDDARPVEQKDPVPQNDDTPEVPAHIVHAARRSGNGLIRLLPTVAWLILAAGLVGAVLSWTTLNDVQASVEGAAAVTPGAIPIALLLGFAYLATGVLGFAFFWVCSMIGGQLKDIQQTLEMQTPYPESEDRPT